ncbi:unnamed protein product [Cylicostephanus goldi]|uniref:Uncharacterized protein n=1 Tax=Cylicostephanus goldi TaxID=71465 RepID=A0A3P6SAB5_CYLGO|nr:unnamed protein product [Cylicostephanus goldi]
MERLLGHKMLYGRLESYTAMGYTRAYAPQEGSSAHVENYNSEGTLKGRRGPHTPPPPESTSLLMEPKQQQLKPRGPRTPPGSPGPRTPPLPEVSQNPVPPVAPAMQTLLANLAAMAGTSGAQLASSLGEDLNRIVGSVNTGVFLESFVTALRTATAQSGASPVVEEKPPQPATPARDVSSRSFSRPEADMDSVKMELVSDCSLSPLPDSQSQSQSPLKAPPPPPPLIAPPPPPPVLPTRPASAVQPPPPPIAPMTPECQNTDFLRCMLMLKYQRAFHPVHKKAAMFGAPPERFDLLE